MSTHEERFQRIERTMEFLLESDAQLSARLDTLAATVERQQVEISEIVRAAAGMQEDIRSLVQVNLDGQRNVRDLAQITVETRQDVRSIAAETRDAINQMIGIAESIAATATTFAERNTDHEIRIRRLETQPPSDAA